MDDLISRQAAINALDRLEYTRGEWATNGLTMCKDAIKALPSAQPDVPDTNVGDMISREAAIEAMRKAKDKSELHRMLAQLPSAQLAQDLTNGCTDTISRQAAVDALDKVAQMFPYRIPGDAKTYRQYNEAWNDATDAAETAIEALPSAQPNLSEAYSKAVFTWLMDYQIRAAELKGRYTPYEVLSWVISDWRKEHERSD